jgi:subtilisin family serine protease
LQDSPILGDVWLAYAADPVRPQDLLITPHREAAAAMVASAISEGLDNERGARVAYLQGIVAATLTFEQLLRILVPATQWWKTRGIPAQIKNGKVGRYTAEALRDAINELFLSTREPRSDPPFKQADFTPLHRYLALAGVLLWISTRRSADPKPDSLTDEEVLQLISSNVEQIVNGLLKLHEKILADQKGEEATENNALIFQVSLNRRAAPALVNSVPSIKADAARSLFTVKCKNIVWAILDAGIDKTHEAFFDSSEDAAEHESRVRKTFDFTNIREIVSSDNADIDDQRLEHLLTGVDLGTANRDKRLKEARRRLQAIADNAKARYPVNWDAVEDLIEVKEPPPPHSPHGTHVGGILGADGQGNGKKTEYSSGVCPDILLYDFRVLGKTLEETEFAIIAALQYIRYVNERHNNITIHGANLSLSIPHNVRNYACGRTPVCNECERLVESGVVVVAAAGNRGYQNYLTDKGTIEGYAAFSVTDPGNSDAVITVGATHGNAPHTYGVSFFSSRGPTGDGRQKPDLVAPGERIQSTILDNDWGWESGTSMAAPHVSGAAAMLMARYSELIGQPRRIKRILCESATDLGRDRSFQGHGMLDVLRAFQSI